jgi:glutamate/tyrosine decarboxylase-like PLP-dependent enzyme
MFACARWTGYSVINTAIQSSKSGGPMAAAWAELHMLGDDGYMDIAKRTLSATRKVIAGIEAIPELEILGRPEFCLVAFASLEISVFHLLDEMRAMGWYLQPQLAFGGSRENVHISVTAAGLERVDEMVAALKECAGRVKRMDGSDGSPLKAALAEVDFRCVTDDELSQMLAMAGIGSGGLPARMADINELMNAMPAEAREKVLIAYFNELFSQPVDTG